MPRRRDRHQGAQHGRPSEPAGAAMTGATDIEAAQFRAIERLRSLLLAGGAIARGEGVRAGIADAINLVQGAIYDARSVAAGVKPRPFTGALNDVPATLTHDEGAYAQCG